MPTTQATLTTSRASRYLTQLGNHAAAMAGPQGHQMRMHRGANPLAAGAVTLRVTQTAGHMILTVDPWGSCTLHAEGDRLALHIDAADEQGLQRIQQIITRDIERFGRREQLSLAWSRSGSPPDPTPMTPVSRPTHARRVRAFGAAAGLVVVAIVVGLHLVLGGAAVATWGWWGWTAFGGIGLAVLALIVGHAALPVLALRLRRHLSRSRRSR